MNSPVIRALLVLTGIWLSTGTQAESIFDNDGGIYRYEPNYFVYADSSHHGSLEDDAHAEFYLSFRYDFYSSIEREKIPGTNDDYHRVSFIYNGLYDFYMFSNDRYSSSPVISRRQNPGLLYEYGFRVDGQREQLLGIGWFHESNGQTIEETHTDNDLNGIDDGVDELILEETNHNREYALAQVSRGWDYLSLLYKYHDRESPWTYQANVRLFCDCQAFGASDREDRIFWDARNTDLKIRDYDGLRLMTEYRMGDKAILRGELQTGISENQWFHHTGGRLTTDINIGSPHTWLTFFYFNGYGKEPSTYHLRTNYYGVGFEFR